MLSDTAFIKGPEVAAFEREFAVILRAAHCVGVANGTDAIELALRASGLPVGAEVVAASEHVRRHGRGRRARGRPTGLRGR